MNEITIKKPEKPDYDCKEIIKHCTVTDSYIMFLLETICNRLKIPFEDPG